MNTANLVTMSRIALTPVVVGCYYSGLPAGQLLAAVVFIIASITDWLDGYLARKLDQTSEFGAFLDPVADKVLVTVVLILLVTSHANLLIPTVIIITREILVSALREWMASRGQRNMVAVAFSGKLKTTLQMIAIGALLLVSDATPALLWQFGFTLVNIAALLSLWSGYQYFKKAWVVLFPADQAKDPKHR